MLRVELRVRVREELQWILAKEENRTPTLLTWKKTIFMWVAWDETVKLKTMGQDLDRSVFWTKDTRVFALWNRLEAQIRALAVATDSGP